MRGSGALFQALLVIGVSCSTAPRPALALPPHDSTTVTTSAYGDTVWFDSAQMRVGSRYLYIGPHGRSGPSPVRRFSTAWARTTGTPVLIEVGDRKPSPTVNEVVECSMRQPKLARRGQPVELDELGNATLEAGHYDDYEGRPLEVWEVDFAPEDERVVRLVFVVIGLAEAQLDTLHRPASIRNTHYLRPFEIPIADRLKTARIVGEYRADLKHGRIERVANSPRGE